MSELTEKFGADLEEGVTQFVAIDDMWPVRLGQIVILHKDDTTSMPEFIVDGSVANVSIKLLKKV